MTDPLPITPRTRLRRAPQRGAFDRATVYAILDAMPLCHVGYVLEGSPVVMPTIQWREGDHVYWHGSAAGRGLKAAVEQEVCLTVSLLDSFVLARSAMHHSVDYRSAMIFGRPLKIQDPDEKAAKLKCLIESLYPGRWDLLRPMTEQEVKATAILSMPIEEASAKIRQRGVVDDEADYARPIWAGVVPVRMQVLEPQADPRNQQGINRPDHASSVELG
ncbi:pyridoxamine 5'-phosphate oxidase family protein [Magnetospira sp. QH-2]|uniref:pyridoxamine 5'-phosphate oxidase family protein n=1 Tax=Magnetospira sp. (strain QH-2) TaxID=1288970 RepID=UPI0003E80F0C|nr:pyridoxamine 5'-phosphate oxidase family protein [Magnetospira sp. QH-2]CCQ74491.1 conserved hypothetical protein [Magnetospira sp. QH-2]